MQETLFKINISLFSVFCRALKDYAGICKIMSLENKIKHKNGMVAQTQIRFMETRLSLYCGISPALKVETQGEQQNTKSIRFKRPVMWSVPHLSSDLTYNA